MNEDNARVWLSSLITIRPWKRHSLILVMTGLAHLTFGATYLYLAEGGPRMRMLVVPLKTAPVEFWAHVFMWVGAFIILSSVWPGHSEKWGYVVATGWSAAWAAQYLIGAYLLQEHYAANIAMGSLFTLIAFLYWGISGLVNPDDVAIVVVEDELD